MASKNFKSKKQISYSTRSVDKRPTFRFFYVCLAVNTLSIRN